MRFVVTAFQARLLRASRGPLPQPDCQGRGSPLEGGDASGAASQYHFLSLKILALIQKSPYMLSKRLTYERLRENTDTRNRLILMVSDLGFRVITVYYG